MAKRFTLAVIGTAATVAVGGVGEAKADAYAYSFLGVTADLTLADGTDITPDNFADLNIVNSASDFAQLDGVIKAVDAHSDSGDGNISIAPAFVDGAGGGVADNLWTRLSDPPDSGVGPNYARSDADLDGSILLDGAVSQTVGEALVDGNAGEQIGSTSSFTDTTTEFVFSTTEDGQFLFSGTFTYQLIAQLTEASTLLKNATAEVDFGLEIFELGPAVTDEEEPIFDESILNVSRSRNTFGESNSGEVAGSFSVLTPVLEAGIFYRGVITQTSETDVIESIVQVPEPGTLGLLGGGLLALGAAGVWRRRSENRDAA